MALAPGTLLGRYEILAPLGAGGMAEVYRARDPRLGREVAVKVLPDCCADPAARARFEREARAVAGLSHPGIVAVHDVGVEGDIPYLVCELLAGESLAARLERGPLPVAEVLDLGLELAQAVAAAHERGVVHRDLKPSNLFLTPEGVKVLDFGLATLGATARGPDDATGELPVVTTTTPGMAVGTVGYMAPEQVRGEEADPRADLFAVGAILYESLTGRPPFARSTVAGTLGALLREAPAPPEAGLGVPPDLWRVVLHCLEKRAADRFQSGRDVAFALESVARGSGPGFAVQPAAERGPSIAVLPFADMSPGRDQGFFCEGIAEELINALARLPGLSVASRTSSFQFGEGAADVREIGRRLGVATVLEGSVRRAGERLRVTVQLVDVADGYHRWSERYDREVADVFAIQDEIAESVVRSLQGVLTEGERRVLKTRKRTEVEAYEYFLRGRQHLHRMQRRDLVGACRLFERALEIDPDFASAWAGIANVHSLLHTWWGAAEADLEKADRASRRALELRPDLAEAHAARGLALSVDRRYAESEREFAEALRLDPNHFEASYYWGRTCFAQGKLDEAAELMGRAAAVRPEDFQSLLLTSMVRRMQGHDEEALAATRESVERVRRHLEVEPDDGRALYMGALALLDLGGEREGREWIERAERLYPGEGSVLYNAACFYSKLGDREAALDRLDRLVDAGFGMRDWIARDPDLAPLRDDPRFTRLIERLA
jgi:non-specific serine/threonine protein kinase